MGAYAYLAPTTVAEAVAILDEQAKLGSRVQVLAGGTDLLVQMRTVDRAPRTILDVKKIEDVNRVEIGADETYIGAAVASAVLNENQDLVKLFPGLLEAADLIGSTQIQGRATIGGNLCNASPAGDSIPALMVNAATCVIASGGGTRELSVAEFTTGPGSNALAANEFLLGLKLQNPQPRQADAYLRFIPRTEMDIAVAGCGVALGLDDSGTCTMARVAIGAVAATVLLVPAAADALLGSTVDEAALQAAGIACTEAASPISDKRGTAEYRRKVVAVLCRRAAQIAKDRALA